MPSRGWAAARGEEGVVAHGEWLPWLASHAEVLGFDTPRTAQRLIHLADKYDASVALGPDEALVASREVWGHSPKAKPAARHVIPPPHQLVKAPVPSSLAVDLAAALLRAPGIIRGLNAAAKTLPDPADRHAIVDAIDLIQELRDLLAQSSSRRASVKQEARP